jgi:hypothetical protein
MGRVLERTVLRDRGEPDRAHPEPAQVVELRGDAGERAALENAVLAIEREMTGRRGRIVEAIDQKRVDPVVPPVGRGREEGRDADLAPADPDPTLGWARRLRDGGLDDRTPDG